MKKIGVFISIFLVFCQEIRSQQQNLSKSSEISILTVGPGDAFYETFGHSAIRVKDPILSIDVVYNYGLFDFNQPNFEVNFTKGRLLYKLGKESFRDFAASYNAQQRWMKSQVLNLSQSERQKIFDFLEFNSLPQNAEYLYDPYFNNCATKLRDISKSALGDKVIFPSSFEGEKYTLRQLMNRELHWNTWANFGINLALGNRLDKRILAEQYMYLPDYLFEGFKNAKKNENNLLVPLIKKEGVILDYQERKIVPRLHDPFFIFCLLLLVTVGITYHDQKTKKRARWLDFMLFLMTGLLGSLIVYLWFFTDHSTTPNNFNFFWAFFPNTFVAFLLLKETLPNWIFNYLKFYQLFLLATLLTWIFSIQLFSFVLIPILGTLFFRVYHLNKLLSPKK